MGSDTKPVKCASCRVPAKVAANAKDNDLVVCPKCGRSDTLKNVTASLADQAVEHARKRLARGFRDSKNFKVATKPVKKRRHRFYVDL